MNVYQDYEFNKKKISSACHIHVPILGNMIFLTDLKPGADGQIFGFSEFSPSILSRLTKTVINLKQNVKQKCVETDHKIVTKIQINELPYFKE